MKRRNRGALMGKLLSRELALVGLSGLVAWLFVPALFRQTPALPLLVAGLLLGMTYAPLYALALMGGRRLPAVVRGWLGPIAWVMVFFNELLIVVQAWLWGKSLTPAALYLQAAPGLFALLLTVLAVFRHKAGVRQQGALWALYLYSVPMVVIRLLFVPAMSVNLVLPAVAIQCGAVFFLVHGLLRLYAPMGPETEEIGPPLVKPRAVPDAVVGLAEGMLHTKARPFATLPSGELDEQAVSLLLKPGEVEDAVQRLSAALDGKPFAVTPGEKMGGRQEIIIRPRG